MVSVRPGNGAQSTCDQGDVYLHGRRHHGRVVGQVSRRDSLVAIESQRDNPRLYGTPEAHPLEAPGVDAAMTIARGQAVEHGTGILN